MILDIINPSDACLMISDDREAAAVAICLLGDGAYGLEQLDAKDGAEPFKVPMFMFGADPNPWFKENFGHDFAEACTIYRDQKTHLLVEALGSVVYGKLKDIQTFNDALELITQVDGKNEFKRRWNDRRRGSMNNIGKRAHGLARALIGDNETKAKEPA